MTVRQIVIDSAGHAALLVDGRLEDLLMAQTDTLPRPGEIIWSKVDRMVPSSGGAFVKLSADHMGFLREIKGLKQGGGVLVQISSYADPGKAMPVSRRVLFKSSLAIRTPEAPGINVSRQIRDPEERARLTAIAEQIAGEGTGLILRSAAAGADEASVAEAIREVLADETEVAKFVSNPPPAKAPRLTSAGIAVRDWAGEIIETTDAFEHLGISEQIQALASAEAPLPSGGSMVVEATRALVAVDVNTGANFSPGAAMTANIEAARELPRQLRLRGFGGQIVVDFAPLKKMHRKKIEETLRAAFKACPVDTTLAGWTPLGNFELSRKRERRPLTL